MTGDQFTKLVYDAARLRWKKPNARKKAWVRACRLAMRRGRLDAMRKFKVYLRTGVVPERDAIIMAFFGNQ